MDLSTRSCKKELLDRDDIPFADIQRNMQELNFINIHLGGHAISIDGVKQLLLVSPPDNNHDEQVNICEIGCGGGDNLYAIARWCKTKNIKAAFTGIDINPHCIEYANCRHAQLATFITSDYKSVIFAKKPDILFSSLFCHHFTNEELVSMFVWMKENSTAGFFINDLERNVFAFYAIKWLAALFSKSYLVKNDAPLSVARGFRKKEWEILLHKAGIKTFSIQWKWAFRWLIVVKNK